MAEGCRGAAKLASGGLLAAGASRFAAVPAGARQATPETCPTTTLEENKALVERYWAEIWTAGGGESAIADIVAPDEIHHWGVFDDTTGLEAFAERHERFLSAFPDIAARVDQQVAEGDLVVSRWTETATHQGDWLGIPATGNKVEWSGMNIFRIECGKIAEAWGSADHLGLLRQIGGVPPAATPAAE